MENRDYKPKITAFTLVYIVLGLSHRFIENSPVDHNKKGYKKSFILPLVLESILAVIAVQSSIDFIIN